MLYAFKSSKNQFMNVELSCDRQFQRILHKRSIIGKMKGIKIYASYITFQSDYPDSLHYYHICIVERRVIKLSIEKVFVPS